jgi:hypothetical protein
MEGRWRLRPQLSGTNLRMRACCKLKTSGTIQRSQGHRLPPTTGANGQRQRCQRPTAKQNVGSANGVTKLTQIMDLKCELFHTFLVSDRVFRPVGTDWPVGVGHHCQGLYRCAVGKLNSHSTGDSVDGVAPQYE